jgi:hypothetical protein
MVIGKLTHWISYYPNSISEQLTAPYFGDGFGAIAKSMWC